MASRAARQGYHRRDGRAGNRGAVYYLAATLVLLQGLFHATVGLASLLDDGYTARLSDYTYTLGLAGWGCVHLLTGGVLAALGAGLLAGADWARRLLLFAVVASAIVSFVYVPYAPLWATVQLLLDAAIVWAVLAEPELQER